MKLLLALTLLSICSLAFSQEPINSFIIKDKNILWEKTFTTDKDFTSFSKEISTSGLLEEVTIIDSTITGKTIKFTADHKGAGYSAMRTPSYLLATFIRGFAVIAYSPGSYKVTVKRMVTIEAQDTNAGILSSRMGEERDMEFWALNNKGVLRPSFKQDGSKIINYTLEKKFSLN